MKQEPVDFNRLTCQKFIQAFPEGETLGLVLSTPPAVGLAAISNDLFSQHNVCEKMDHADPTSIHTWVDSTLNPPPPGLTSLVRVIDRELGAKSLVTIPPSPTSIQSHAYHSWQLSLAPSSHRRVLSCL